MLNARPSAALLAALFIALPLTAAASGRNDGQPDDRLVDKYTRFAGSERNAEALVDGLRYDSQVKLYSHRGSTSFTPPTDKMGYGNVDIALSLAKATLAEHGIHRPSPEQIKAALNGGTITTQSGQHVTLAGVLNQRASGMGWGKVAQANGFKLGEVMRDKHHRHGKHHDGKDHKHAGWKHRDQHHADWKHRPGDFHRARFDRPDRGQKLDRPERPHKFERPERPERHHRR